MNTRGQNFSFRGVISCGRRALTLLEMMVSVTLLAVIMIGLLAMFSHTQKALHVAVTQTDVFENARGAIQLVARDLSEMMAYDDTNVQNAALLYQPSPAGTLVLPSGASQRMDMTEAFWLTRVNDEWSGIGYYVAEDAAGRANVGVGTLYRFSQVTNRFTVPFLRGHFDDLAVTNQRVSDGVVHFSMEAVYVSGANAFGQPIYGRTNDWQFRADELPAFVDLELGVLEPSTLKQFQSIASLNVTNAQNFLRQHEGRIHFFRERVPIRNFINPYRANEVP